MPDHDPDMEPGEEGQYDPAFLMAFIYSAIVVGGLLVLCLTL
jgi:hypothetical protein